MEPLKTKEKLKEEFSESRKNKGKIKRFSEMGIDVDRDTLKKYRENQYHCYLNDHFYGSGNLSHIHELFRDYVVHHDMYGHEMCEFRITRQ